MNLQLREKKSEEGRRLKKFNARWSEILGELGDLNSIQKLEISEISNYRIKFRLINYILKTRVVKIINTKKQKQGIQTHNK